MGTTCQKATVPGHPVRCGCTERGKCGEDRESHSVDRREGGRPQRPTDRQGRAQDPHPEEQMGRRVGSVYISLLETQCVAHSRGSVNIRYSELNGTRAWPGV